MSLFPQTNPFRQHINLNGYWDFRIDPEDVGEGMHWQQGFSGRPIAVPASWNEQISELRDYLGLAWYQTHFDLPWEWQDKRVLLRFASVDYLAKVWLNGAYLGSHEGGHLPFEFEVSPYLRKEDNLLVVRVDGVLARDRVPPGLVDDPADSHQIGIYPPTTYDFFPYRGIQRPVQLYAIPKGGIDDISLNTAIEGDTGIVRVEVQTHPHEGVITEMVRLTLSGYGVHLQEEEGVENGVGEVTVAVPQAAFWSPTAPHLYDFRLELLAEGRVFDRYTLPVGIRTIQVDGDRLLLNGEPIVLRGFGRHEDFPIFGRGTAPPVSIRDFELMAWTGANSFRTSHYPYDSTLLPPTLRPGPLPGPLPTHHSCQRSVYRGDLVRVSGRGLHQRLPRLVPGVGRSGGRTRRIRSHFGRNPRHLWQAHHRDRIRRRCGSGPPRPPSRDVQRRVPGRVHQGLHRHYEPATLRCRPACLESVRLQDGTGRKTPHGEQLQRCFYA